MRQSWDLEPRERKVLERLKKVRFEVKTKKCPFCKYPAFFFVKYGDVWMCWRCGVRMALKDTGDWWKMEDEGKAP